MLEVVGLRKRFGEVQAVDGVGFSLARGESVGLVGPNGAGKTTTLSMMVGLIRPDEGEVRLEGRPLSGDTDPLKRKIGFVPQELALYEELSAQKNLALFGAVYGLSGAPLREAIEKALNQVGLQDRAKSRVSTFSGGMKRRLNLAAALLHGPEVLFLDEPTVGVDPQSRNAIFEYLEALRAKGLALLYTSHYLEEVERLCERVVIIDHGKVITDQPLKALHRQYAVAGRVVIELAAPADEAWLAALRALPEVRTASVDGDRLSVDLTDGLSQSEIILRFLNGQGVAFTALSTERPSLEAVFLALTDKRLRDA
jgi:ABC-2 type transport system ATP-binding protein